jgi:DNA-binding beta-propeller fold protein YncE
MTSTSSLRLLPLVVWLAAACTPPDGDGADTDVAVSGAASVSLDGAIVGLVDEIVSFEATTVSGAVRVRWDFGDGTGADAAPDTRVAHTYTKPGHYVAGVQVTGADDAVVTDTMNVTITWPVAEGAARSSSSVAVGAGKVFVALEDFDKVAVVDQDGWSLASHIDTCPHPRWVSFLPDPTAPDTRGLLAVACREVAPGVEFFAVDGDSVSQVGELDLTGSGRAPTGVVLADDGTAWVPLISRTDAVGTLMHVSPVGDVTKVLSMGTDLRGLAIQGNTLVVSRFRSADGGGQFWIVDTTTGSKTVHTVGLSPGPDSDTDARGVPNYLAAVAIRPDGRTVTVAGLKDNIQRGLVRDGQPMDDETTVRSDLRQLSLVLDEGPVGKEIGRPRLDNLDLFSGVVYSPLGDWLYAMTYGTRTIQVLDAYDLRQSGIVLDLGIAPAGIATTLDGGALLVDASAERTLMVIDAAPPFANLATIDLRPGGVEVLDAAVLRGKQVFANSADQRMSRFGYASCASCHLEGDDDGRTWDFTDRGEGVRNTISLRGMADRIGTPIHWSGNFDEVQDFEADIRGPQAGLGFLTDAQWAGDAHGTLAAPKAGLSVDLDALAAYVNSLGDLDVPYSGLEAEGRAIFNNPVVGCATCHPDGGSISSWLSPGVPDLRDVGTLTALSGHRLNDPAPLPGVDIPSLHGLWSTAPYLHDGSAPTLRAVLVTRNPDDAHGVTSGLDAAELDALEAYLLTL